jgi:hypothetical protein
MALARSSDGFFDLTNDTNGSALCLVPLIPIDNYADDDQDDDCDNV